MLTQKRAIIVGAGIGGLTTAARLAKQGWSVDIYEARHEPGGRLGRVTGDGYTFDVGPTIVLMTDVFRTFFQEIGLRMEDYLNFQLLDPNYRLHFADGSVMDSSSNLQRMMTEIEKIAPSDLDGFMQYLSKMYRRYRIARHDFIEQPMLSVKELFRPATLKKLYELHTLNTMSKDIAKYIQDERLRLALTFQSLYIGIDPAEAPSIYNVIGYMELTYSGVWYCEGGYHRVAQVFAQIAEEMGVRIHYGERVQSVLEESGQVIGVKLANSTVSYADAVVVNADFPTAARTLLPDRAKGKMTNDRTSSMKQSCSAFMLYLGSNKRFPHATVHGVHFSRDFRENMRHVFTSPQVPEHPSFYVHVPTRIDPSVAPTGKEAIYVLVPVANNRSGINWNEAAPKLRSHILHRLEEAGFEGLSESIEFERMITPDDWEQSFSLEAGAAFGVLPSLRQSAYWRPSLKSKTVNGLYFIGASTHPGGGIPIVMTGAAALEQVMIRDYEGVTESFTSSMGLRASERDGEIAL